MVTSEQIVGGIFASAGVPIGNPGDPKSLQVRDRRFFRRVLLDGTLGLGESYVEGWWECAALDEVVARLIRRSTDDRPAARWLGSLVGLRHSLRARAFDLQGIGRARRDVPAHYDADEQLLGSMLGQRMIYSCAYWKNARDLDEAQVAKLDLVCRKLELQPGMRLLDLGCGWGGFARYAVEHHDVEVVGVTAAPRQAAHAKWLCAGLPIEIRLADYRDIRGRFDRVVSLGMLEHVGHRNHATFMQVLRKCLVPDGLALVQVIGNAASTTYIDPWTSRYIFPNAVLPSVKQLGAAMESTFVLEDWHNFGADYDRTLLAWNENLESARLTLKERSRRMWRYHLLSRAGAFRARRCQLWQIVLSPHGVPGGYHSVR